MQDAGQVALLDALEGEGGNESGADTTTVLGSQDLDGVFLLMVGLLGPVEDLAQGLGAAGLEVGVLVEDGAVGANVGRLVALLLADGGDAAGREAGGAGADELGEAADELELGAGGLEAELGDEQVVGLLEVLEGVTGRVSTYVLLRCQVEPG